jgi:hypothetical protein
MDYLRSSVLSLLRGPLLFTPQGWVVLATAILCWSWIGYLWFGRGAEIATISGDRELLIFSTWPFVVFLFYLRLCSPHFQASWTQSLLLAITAVSLPVFEVLR